MTQYRGWCVPRALGTECPTSDRAWQDTILCLSHVSRYVEDAQALTRARAEATRAGEMSMRRQAHVAATYRLDGGTPWQTSTAQ
jgi:hypothetical protein